jgi:hypothetical protein
MTKIKDTPSSAPMLPKLPVESLSTTNTRQIQNIQTQLAQGINRGNDKNSPLPLSAISTHSTKSNKKGNAKLHLQNKKNGVMQWRNVW